MFKFYLNRKTTLFTYHLLFQEDLDFPVVSNKNPQLHHPKGTITENPTPEQIFDAIIVDKTEDCAKEEHYSEETRYRDVNVHEIYVDDLNAMKNHSVIKKANISQISDKPSYNKNPNSDINVTIKYPSERLLGIYYDAASRDDKRTILTNSLP